MLIYYFIPIYTTHMQGVDTYMCETDRISDGDLCGGVTFYVPRKKEDRSAIFVRNQPSRELLQLTHLHTAIVTIAVLTHMSHIHEETS